MTARSDPNSQTQPERLPGTVFTPRQVRMLKVAVVVMGLALVGGFALVLGSIVYQASQLGKAARPPGVRPADAVLAAQAALKLEPGQTIAHIALDGDRLALHLAGPAGAEIRIIDLRTGAVTNRLTVKPE